MTLPFGVTEILDSALKRFPRKDIVAALSWPAGADSNCPRRGVAAIGGFTTQGLPIVVLRAMDTGVVFHAQKREPKYDHLFGKTRDR